MNTEFTSLLPEVEHSDAVERAAAHQHLLGTVGMRATQFLFGDHNEHHNYIIDAVVKKRAEMRAAGMLYQVGDNGKEVLNPLDFKRLDINPPAINKAILLQAQEKRDAADERAIAANAAEVVAAKEAQRLAKWRVTRQRTIDAKKPFKPEGPLVGLTPPASHEELWAQRQDAQHLTRVRSGEMIRRMGDVPVGEEFTVGGEEGRGGKRFADMHPEKGHLAHATDTSGALGFTKK